MEKLTMKKTIIAIVCILCVQVSFSQDRRDPPSSVRNSFHREYPQSQPSQWSHVNGEWSVNFEDRDHDNGEVTAHFDIHGRHLATHVPYDDHDVPDPVMSSVRSRYPGSDYEFTRIDHPHRNSQFEVKVRSKNRHRTVYMDERGREARSHY
jgi:hypothetical protein